VHLLLERSQIHGINITLSIMDMLSGHSGLSAAVSQLHNIDRSFYFKVEQGNNFLSFCEADVSYYPLQVVLFLGFLSSMMF
jgi:hypothetical protein